MARRATVAFFSHCSTKHRPMRLCSRSYSSSGENQEESTPTSCPAWTALHQGLFRFSGICRKKRSEPPRTRTWNLEIKRTLHPHRSVLAGPEEPRT